MSMSTALTNSYVHEIVNAIDHGVHSSRECVQGTWTDRDQKIAIIAGKEAVKAWSKYYRETWPKLGG